MRLSSALVTLLLAASALADTTASSDFTAAPPGQNFLGGDLGLSHDAVPDRLEWSLDYSFSEDFTSSLHHYFSGGLDWTPNDAWDLPVTLSYSPWSGTTSSASDAVGTKRGGKTVIGVDKYLARSFGVDVDPAYTVTGKDADVGTFDADLSFTRFDADQSVCYVNKSGKCVPALNSGTQVLNQLRIGPGAELVFGGFRPSLRVDLFSDLGADLATVGQFKVRGLKSAGKAFTAKNFGGLAGGLPAAPENYDVKVGGKYRLGGWRLSAGYTWMSYIASGPTAADPNVPVGPYGGNTFSAKVQYKFENGWSAYVSGSAQVDLTHDQDSQWSQFGGLGLSYTWKAPERDDKSDDGSESKPSSDQGI